MSIPEKMNPEKIKKIVGWEQKVFLKEGLSKTIEWMKAVSGK